MVFRDPEGDGLPLTFTHPSVVLGCLSEIQAGGRIVVTTRAYGVVATGGGHHSFTLNGPDGGAKDVFSC